MKYKIGSYIKKNDKSGIYDFIYEIDYYTYKINYIVPKTDYTILVSFGIEDYDSSSIYFLITDIFCV